jgi:hypothetical protein
MQSKPGEKTIGRRNVERDSASKKVIVCQRKDGRREGEKKGKKGHCAKRRKEGMLCQKKEGRDVMPKEGRKGGRQ